MRSVLAKTFYFSRCIWFGKQQTTGPEWLLLCIELPPVERDRVLDLETHRNNWQGKHFAMWSCLRIDFSPLHSKKACRSFFSTSSATSSVSYSCGSVSLTTIPGVIFSTCLSVGTGSILAMREKLLSFQLLPTHTPTRLFLLQATARMEIISYFMKALSRSVVLRGSAMWKFAVYLIAISTRVPGKSQTWTHSQSVCSVQSTLKVGATFFYDLMQ